MERTCKVALRGLGRGRWKWLLHGGRVSFGGVEMFFGGVEMFWDLIEVMTAPHCVWIESQSIMYFQIVNFMLGVFCLKTIVILNSD